MKLSKSDWRIIDATFLNAQASAQEIANRLSCRPHTVRRCLERLRGYNVLHSYTFLNVYPIGLMHFGLFFKLTSRTAEVRNFVLSTLISDKRVSFITETGGEFDFGISICVSSISEAHRHIDQLCRICHGMIDSRVVAIRTKLRHFSPKFMLPHSPNNQSIWWGEAPACAPLDSIDFSVLNKLSNSPELLSESELAISLDLPRTTLRYRLQSLRERGILKGAVHILDTEALGVASHYLLVSTPGFNQMQRDRFLQFCSENRQVYFAVECLGSWNFEIGIMASSTSNVLQAVEQLLGVIGKNLQWYSLLEVYSYHKVVNLPIGGIEQEHSLSATIAS